MLSFSGFTRTYGSFTPEIRLLTREYFRAISYVDGKKCETLHSNFPVLIIFTSRFVLISSNVFSTLSNIRVMPSRALLPEVNIHIIK